MNQMTRTKLAVLVTLFVVAFRGSIALADTASDYETLFGTEAKKVTASRTKTDDAAFAAKLIKSAEKLSDSPAMQVLLYEKACQFGAASPAGCDTALEAVALLEKAVPDKKDQWRQRKFDIVKLRYDKSYGAAKKTAGESYMEMLEVLADANVAEGKGDEAKKLYSRAIMVARYIKSDRAETILGKSRQANAAVAQQVKFKLLQARLKKDAGNTKVRKELILLYVVGLDNPTEAAKLITDDIDEVTRTYVPLAAKKLDGLEEAICLELGDWYYRTLSKNASAAGKPVVLQRAKGYYEQFAELHTKNDVQSLRVETALESIEKELKKLGAPADRAGSKTLILTLGKGVTMKLVRIPAGKLVLDSPKSKGPPKREMVVGGFFYMGVTEVTQAQYVALMGSSPWKGQKYSKEQADCPANYISWNDAVAFCEKLSAKVHRTVRLPSEQEWEYCCRAGSMTRYYYGDDPEAKKLDLYVWYSANTHGKGEKYPHPVGKKLPNSWGLYDMYGNVAESVLGGTEKYNILRGGSFGSSADGCVSESRYAKSPRGYRDYVRGFRVVVVSGSGVK